MNTIYPVIYVTFNLKETGIDEVAAIRLDAVDCMKGTREKKPAFSDISVLQLDYVQRKPLVRGQLVNSRIRNIEVIGVFHCGGRTLLGWDTVIASDQIRPGYTKK